MAENSVCAIWATSATTLPTDRDGLTCDSPRVGGRYFISGSAAAVIRAIDDRSVCQSRLNPLLSSSTAPLRSWFNGTRGEKTALGAVFSCLMRVNAPIEARDQDNSLH